MSGSGVRSPLDGLGPRLELAQVRLDPAGQRRPSDLDEDARPAIEWLEGGRVDDPRPAGDRFQSPRPFALEASACDADTEARLRARLEALDPCLVAQQPETSLRG